MPVIANQTTAKERLEAELQQVCVVRGCRGRATRAGCRHCAADRLLGGHHAGYDVKPSVLYPSHGSVTVVVCRVLFVGCTVPSSSRRVTISGSRDRSRGWITPSEGG